MRLPFQQRTFRLAMYFASGIIMLGAFLDSINNSISLSLNYAVVLIVILAFAWVGIETTLRVRAQRWVLRGGQKSTVKKLGVWPRLAFVGALSMLLIPKLGVVFNYRKDDNRPAASPPQAAAGHPVEESPKISPPAQLTQMVPSPTTPPPTPSPTQNPRLLTDPPRTSLQIGKRESASIYVNQARAMYGQGQYSAALASCDIALKLDPKNRDAINLKKLIVDHIKVLDQ